MDKSHFRQEAAKLDTEELLARRREADGYVFEAQSAIEEELLSRGVSPPPIPSKPIIESHIRPRASTGGARWWLQVLWISLCFKAAELALKALKVPPDVRYRVWLVCLAGLAIYWFVRKAAKSDRDAARERIGTGGYSELMFCAADGDTARMEELLKYGASVNAQDAAGVTALMNAASNGHSAAAEALIRSGANPALKSNSGKTAADYARASGHASLALLLTSGSVGESDAQSIV